MRTTLTIDESLGVQLKARMRKTGQSLKQTVNELLQLGLGAAADATRGKRKRFRVKAAALGERPGIDYLKTSDMLDRVDGVWGP